MTEWQNGEKITLTLLVDSKQCIKNSVLETELEAADLDGMEAEPENFKAELGIRSNEARTGIKNP